MTDHAGGVRHGYETLKTQVQPITFAVLRRPLIDEVLKEVTSQAIYNLFHQHTAFRGESSLKTYFTSIVRNTTIDCLRKISRQQKLFRYGARALRRADRARALAEFKAQEKPASLAMVAQVGNLFQLIKLPEQRLTDREFVVVALKFAGLYMKEKLTDEELASKLGLRRTTFLDSFQRGIHKITRYWKEHPEGKEVAVVRPVNLLGAIEASEQRLTDREFVVVALKFASLYVEKKLTDAELARKLGLSRTTFRDSFQRGARKIFAKICHGQSIRNWIAHPSTPNAHKRD